MNATMERIHQLASERLGLYHQASHGGLSNEQRERLGWIDTQLPMLWDQYRRELAAYTWSNVRPARTASQVA
jgi:hypothetical protein